MFRAAGRGLLLSMVLLIVSLGASAQPGVSPIRDRYVKYEVNIPMRDGIRLRTVIFLPKDESEAHPIMLCRTPYSIPYGPENFQFRRPSDKFIDSNYIIAHQDVRGRYMSEGEFVNVRPVLPKSRLRTVVDDSTDTYDTIEWLINCLPNNNGRVGMWGISYPGFYTSVGSVNSHPALKASSPQAPIGTWFIGDDTHHNGAFFLMDNFFFINGVDRVRSGPTKRYPRGVPLVGDDAYDFFLKEMGPIKNANDKFFKDQIPYWNELVSHGNYDSYWKERNVLPRLKNITSPTLTVGGWYDAEDLHGALKTYSAIEAQNPGLKNMLVMGPWSHGGWSGGPFKNYGDIDFGSETGTYYRNEIEFPFFDFYLRDRGTMKLPEASIFHTGVNRWEAFDKWPPAGIKTKNLYLRENRSLSFNPPTQTKDAVDSYVSDPSAPTPYTGVKSFRRNSLYMIEDQRFATGRPDVLTYQTEVLTSDLTLMGPIFANLFTSISTTDADFVVKVIDVLPDDAPDNAAGKKMGGYQSLVRGEVMRGKFRNSFSKPEPFKPGEVSKVRFELQDVCHTFKKGHRLMIQVQSAWFPLVDRNPQTFVDIYRALESDFVKSTISIHRGVTAPSHIIIGVKE